ncbi:Adaptin N terminal region Adaptin C terminal domain [Trypanosoma vivax]|uniref:AP-1 complex subunit gamma n=1 Tax=Trypanosoma vivax (strain Y486) TaxID=1055687 RepID=G0TTV0_TRYVY|nr:putative AP-1 adapter complex gamma subunit [Trypanosoma vivax]KAH8613879.1 Adaptin N terminal region Adaptin C terminal domain [Trypanosoma vivax]CCC47383.1 putative AP-1 adapter complex gamma subunit [Trypanosoma vivax Y486]
MASNSQKLRDLITAVRQCKTAAEERILINKESAIIRESLRGGKSHSRTRNMLKLLYISMLGYPTEFGQVEVVSLLGQADYEGKRVGYLTLQMVLSENDEVLMLAENHIKKDLASHQPLLQSMALNVVANIASESMARDMLDDVVSLMGSTNPYITKKACLAAIRIVKKVPDYAEVFLQESLNIFQERDQAVLQCMLTLVNECLQQPQVDEYLTKYRLTVRSAVNLLKQLVLSSRVTLQDIGGIANPFLQIKLLQFMRIIGKGSAVISEALNDVLAQVLTNTDGSRKPGCAVQYECVRTIYKIESDSGLRALGISTVGRFLISNDNNLRFVALKTLLDCAAIDGDAVREHLDIILDCLKDPDVSIRRRALELVVALINEHNVRLLVPDLLTYLTVCAEEMRAAVTQHLCRIVEIKSPTTEWRVEFSLRLLRLGRQHVSQEFATRFIALLSNEKTEIQTVAINSLWEEASYPFDALHHSRKAFLLAAVWCIGEYADLLSSNGISMEKVANCVVDIVNHTEFNTIKCYGLTALAKIASKHASTKPLVTSVFGAYASSLDCELQQRACEYMTLLDSFPEEAAFCFGPMPPITRITDGGKGGVQLLQLAERSKATPKPNATVGLDDLFGVGGTSGDAPAPSGNSTQRLPAPSIDDLFGGAPSAPSGALQASDLFGTGPASQVRVMGSSATPAVASLAVVPVFECADFSVGLSAVVQGTIAVSLTIESRLSMPMEDISIQVAVPKSSSLEIGCLPTTVIPARGRIVQQMVVDNSKGNKDSRLVMLKVKFVYSVNGEPRSQLMHISQEA